MEAIQHWWKCLPKSMENSIKNEWQHPHESNGNCAQRRWKNPYTMEWEINILDKHIKRTSMEESTQNYSKIHPKFKKPSKISGRPHPELLRAQKKSDRKSSRIDWNPNREPMQKINQNRWAIDPNIDGRGNPTSWGKSTQTIDGEIHSKPMGCMCVCRCVCAHVRVYVCM